MPAIKVYSDVLPQRLRQLAGDFGLLVWVSVWVGFALAVRTAVLKLATPGIKLDAAGTRMAGQLRDAGSTVGGIPYVGDDAAKPFNGAGGSADDMASAGRSQVAAVHTLSTWLGVTVALIPILVALAIYLPPRIRFARHATAGQRLLDAGADLDLFALRAVAHQPLQVLVRVSDDPAGAWRRKDPDVVRQLTALELKDVGLVLPPSFGSVPLRPSAP